jgi:hypothetical protein
MDHPARMPTASRSPGAARSGSRLEKRGYGRIPARSHVELRYGRKLGAIRQAELLNVGRAGFRARHADARLIAGKLVAFRHQFGDGFARVRWTNSNGGGFESGFEIVEPRL